MTNFVISGSRDYHNEAEVWKFIEESLHRHGITDFAQIHVHHGCCRGVDRAAENWCIEHGVVFTGYPVSKKQWDHGGLSTGPKRNAKMIANGDVLIAIGYEQSKGTNSAVRLANEAGLAVYHKILPEPEI